MRHYLTGPKNKDITLRRYRKHHDRLIGLKQFSQEHLEKRRNPTESVIRESQMSTSTKVQFEENSNPAFCRSISNPSYTKSESITSNTNLSHVNTHQI